MDPYCASGHNDEVSSGYGYVHGMVQYLSDSDESTDTSALEDMDQHFLIDHNNSTTWYSEDSSDSDTEIPMPVTLPEKPILKRRRARHPEEHASVKMKRARLSGVAHIGAKGQAVPARHVKPKDCSKCPKKCSIKISEVVREQLNKDYWELDSIQKKNQFIVNWVEESPKQARTTSDQSRRQMSRWYYLPVSGKKTPVCKGFFLKTLSISDSKVRRILKNLPNSRCAPGDGRGKSSGRRLPDIDRDIVRDHINCFPKVPSHYCRANSNCEYLAPDLNVSKMYIMYTTYCEENGFNPVKRAIYYQVFNTEFNLKFHAPRKDQCDLCFQYDHSTPERQSTLRPEYDRHLKRKKDAAEFHDKAKDDCLSGLVNFIEMDLAAVRYCPSVEAKGVFYKNRLAVFNFTIYDVATRLADCYMWHEGVAGRGSTETGSCIYKYIQGNANGKPLVIMSDTCGGQNRNSNVASLLLYCVKSLDVPVIDQCFYEPGHSFMECDNVHALIERSTKKLEVFDPSGWYAGVRMSNKKYTVYEMDRKEFVDVKGLRERTLKNKKKDTDMDNINWFKISWLRYRKDDPDHIYYKYEKSEEFRKFRVMKRARRNVQEEMVLEEVYKGQSFYLY